MFSQVIAKNVRDVFFETHCTSSSQFIKHWYAKFPGQVHLKTTLAQYFNFESEIAEP